MSSITHRGLRKTALPRTGRELDAVAGGVVTSSGGGASSGGSASGSATDHSQLTGVISTADKYSDSAKDIHLTADAAKELERLLTLEIIESTDEETIPTDENLYSALKAKLEDEKIKQESEGKFIRKDKPDETNYLVEFHDGITTGVYVGGFLGDGAIIDKDGNAEMTSLKLREFLEVPELRFNRIDVVSGELWNAVAFGLIEEVDEVNQIVKLKLEEGELSGMHLSDFCRGIFHNLTDNEATPGVDGSGFDVMVGFRTSYFTPVEIIDNARFKYELKPGSTVHPCKSMKFAVYGNPVDKNRQSSAYHTRTYTRYLREVNTWKIEAKHISMQLGDLSNLVINGESLAEGSVYLNNVYFGGNIRTVGELGSLKGQDAYSVTLSTYSAVYNIADGVYEQADVVSGENKVVTGVSQVVASQFNVSTQLQVFKGPEQLRFSNIIGSGKYIVTSSGTNCTYVITDGLVAVQEVTEDKAEIKIEVNCEGIAVYEVVFTIVRVADGRDGKDYEYIFTRTSTQSQPETPSTSQTDDFVPVGWTDDSVGPTLDFPFEWVCKRVKRDSIWRDYSTPSLWARFGEDGTDYEYIYYRTSSQSQPVTPGMSQKDDYIPSGWTDDPVGPTRQLPFEWISKRAKVDSVWSAFSTPALWSKFAEDGTDHEFIYRRTTSYSTPATPSTSQTDDFVPSGWTDDPVGVTSTYIYEWMSKRDKVKGSWGSFSTPSLWAKYSFDGEDGKPGSDGRPGADGKPGIQGPGLNYRGEWSSTVTYYRNNNLVDIVSITNNGIPTFYLLLASSDKNHYPGSYPSIWDVQNSFKNVATDLLFAKDATIANWQFNNSYIRSLNNEVCLNGSGVADTPVIACGSMSEHPGYYNGDINKNASLIMYQSGIIQVGPLGGAAGMCGTGLTSSNAVRFWAGSTYNNRSNAPFKVDHGGNFTGNKCNLTGSFQTSSGGKKCIISTDSSYGATLKITDASGGGELVLYGPSSEVGSAHMYIKSGVGGASYGSNQLNFSNGSTYNAMAAFGIYPGTKYTMLRARFKSGAGSVGYNEIYEENGYLKIKPGG